MGTADNDVAGSNTSDHSELHASYISRQTLEPGLYKWVIDASFAGIVLAINAITVNTGTTMNGRLFSQTAVTLEMNTITQLPHPCNDKPSCYINPHKYNKGLSNEF